MHKWKYGMDRELHTHETENVKEPKALEVSDNHIYFYSEVDRVQVLTLNKTLRDKVSEIKNNQIMRDMEKPYPIFLHVMSYGGDVFSGLAAMDQIIQVRKHVPIVTIVDGCCASAASLISVVGTRRIISPNSFMLIHQLSSGFWGKFEEFKDEMENLKRIMDKLKTVYGKYAKIPAEKLDEILSHDLWIGPDQCLEWGLVDEIAKE